MVVAGEDRQYAAYHLETGATPVKGFYESPNKAKQAALRKMQTKKDKSGAALKNLTTVNVLPADSTATLTHKKASGPTT